MSATSGKNDGKNFEIHQNVTENGRKLSTNSKWTNFDEPDKGKCNFDVSVERKNSKTFETTKHSSLFNDGIIVTVDGKTIENGKKGQDQKKIACEIEIEVCKTRFWNLALFSYSAFLVIIVWGTFGPIVESVEYAFDWEDGYIALLSGWAPVFSVSCMIPFGWITQKYGLRIGMLLAASLITMATGVRCLSVDDTAFTYLASVGAIMNGMGSCLTLSLPAMLSATWFPKNERATATAVGALATQFGGVGMYMSPLIVRTPDGILTKDEIKSDIRILMLIHFGMAAFGLLCIVIYFPEKPLKPPSVSCSVERVSYFKSIKLLIRHRDVMMILITYIFSLAIPLSWIAVMNFSLECIGIPQDESLWIAITACTASPILAFIVARVTDHFYGYLRISIIGLLFGSSCFFLWFLLMTEGVIIASKAQVFVAIVFAISLQYSTVSLLIELAMELAYPCPETVVGGILIFSMDSISTIFLLLMIIPSTCYRWLSYALCASTSLTIIPMIFVKEVYNRAELDQNLLTAPESVQNKA